MAVTDSSLGRILKGETQSRKDEAQKLWVEALQHLRLQVNAEGFDTWLAPTRAQGFQQDGLLIEVPNSFFAEWIGQHYSADIKAALAAVTGQAMNVAFRPRDVADAALLRRREPNQRRPVAAQNGYRLQARYTFGNFIVGESSRLACAAARSVAEAPATSYNPLFIYGGVGLGKTHLLQAIGNHALGVRRNLKVYYVAAETLFIELIQAIEKNTRLDFKRKYRSLDLLLLDDIHYLVGKERLQEEVFHIFNHLQDSGSQVAFTSDRPPKEIPTLEDRLVSRLGSGLVVDIQPPELETRIAILKQKAALDERDLPDDVAYFIAARVKSSVRELEGCLVRLLALASLSDRSIDVALAEEALKDIVVPELPVDQGAIAEAVGESFGVSLTELKGSRRTRQLALARQVAMYLMRKLLDLSLKEVGLFFGDRDHTTVMHAVDKIEQMRVKDPAFEARVKKLTSSIRRG